MSWEKYKFPYPQLNAPLLTAQGLIDALNERRFVLGLSEFPAIDPLTSFDDYSPRQFQVDFENYLNVTLQGYVNHTINDGDFTGLEAIPMWTVDDIYEYLNETRIDPLSVVLVPIFYSAWAQQKYRVINLLRWIRDVNAYYRNTVNYTGRFKYAGQGTESTWDIYYYSTTSNISVQETIETDNGQEMADNVNSMLAGASFYPSFATYSGLPSTGSTGMQSLKMYPASGETTVDWSSSVAVFDSYNITSTCPIGEKLSVFAVKWNYSLGAYPDENEIVTSETIHLFSENEISESEITDIETGDTEPDHTPVSVYDGGINYGGYDITSYNSQVIIDFTGPNGFQFGDWITEEASA